MCSPRPLLSASHRGHPRSMTALASANCFVSELYHPARSHALLLSAARVAPRCVRTGLPGGGLLPGKDLLELSMSTSLAHLLSPAGFDRRLPCPEIRRAYPTLAGSDRD